jgi:hypothetical protein
MVKSLEDIAFGALPGVLPALDILIGEQKQLFRRRVVCLDTTSLAVSCVD